MHEVHERTVDEASVSPKANTLQHDRGVDTDLLIHLVRPLLPPVPDLSPSVSTQVERAVVAFVAAQIAVMPTYLRIPYRLALFAFNWLALLRYGRPYVALDGARQQRYVLAWANSPIGVMRDFVKLIRSCALLCYLDHPLVLEQLETWE